MGNGILGVWSSITAEAAEDYDAWYEREHMFERLEVPGFRRAKHYATVSGSPQFFTYFELDAPSVVVSPAYLTQSNNSSAWTQRILPHFRDANRTAFSVVRRVGRGYGSAAMTVRVNGTDDTIGAVIDRAGPVLDDIATRPGIMGGQIWRADLEATIQPGKDRELRHGDDLTSDLVIFVEGTGTDPLLKLADDAGLRAALEGATRSDIAVHRLMNGAEADEAPRI